MKKLHFDAKDITSDIEKLQKSDLFKNIHITPENYLSMLRFEEEFNNCRGCRGLDSCKNRTKGYKTVIEDGYEKQVRCKYMQAHIENLHKNSLITTMYMPKTFADNSLNGFVATNEIRQKAKNYAISFCSSFSEQNFVKGMYLCGAYGTGKTYLLSAIANELAKNDIKSLLIYFPDVISELKASMGTPKFQELINLLKSIPVLMLDDFGSEYMTSWVRDEIISPVINYRVAANLPIFISSNLSLAQLFNHLSDTKSEIDTLKAGRIIGRIRNSVIFSDFGNAIYTK